MNTDTDPELVDVCFEIEVTGVSSSGGKYDQLLLYNADFDAGTSLLVDATKKKTCKKAKPKDILIIQYLSNDAVSLFICSVVLQVEGIIAETI